MVLKYLPIKQLEFFLLIKIKFQLTLVMKKLKWIIVPERATLEIHVSKPCDIAYCTAN